MYMKKTRFIAVLITLIVFGWQCGNNEISSDDLIGVWKTSEPKYTDRSFEITKGTITFGIGEGNFEIYSIKKIRMEKIAEEKSILYTIYYENSDGDENIFAFYYTPEKGGIIRFKNQRQIEWEKQSNR
jgi:hypothetical protein